MKKLIFTLCALCLCGTMWGQDSQYGLYYTVSDDEATIVAPTDGSTYSNSNLATYTGDEVAEGVTAVTIPEYVDGYAVVAIGEKAFQAATIEGHFVLPGYVNTVGAGAFLNCTGITEVTFEYNSVTLMDQSTQVYNGMFNSCSGVTTVNLNRDITLGKSGTRCAPFSYTTSITTVYIGEYVTYIPDYMFNNRNTYSLSTVYSYASTPPTLGTEPFDYLASEHNLYVNYDDVFTYKADDDWRELFGRDNIHSLTGEDPIDENAFYYEGLWYDPIFAEDGVTETGEAQIIESQDEAYSGTITIPEIAYNGEKSYNVTRIDAEAFQDSDIEGHIIIPANIVSVGIGAFLNCTGITEVTFEYSPTALVDENTSNTTQMFNGCSGITTVNLNRDITLGKSESGSLCAPFCYMTSVTTVYIGENVTLVPDYMFRNTKSTASLSTVYCYASTPPTLGRTPFDNLADEHTFYTQAVDLSKYKEDSDWTEAFGEENMFPYDAFYCFIDPESDTSHESLDVITFSYRNGIYWNEDEENGYEGGPVTYVDPEGNEVEMDNMGTTWDPSDPDKEIAQIIMFEENPMVEAGDYTVTVPASFFYSYDVNGKKVYNDVITLTYTIVPPLCDLATGLYFEVDDNGVVSILASKEGVYSNDNLVKNDDGSYTLPSYVEDKRGESGYVTRVDASAFESASISGHLVIPATITAVGSKAFYNCTGLTEVTLEYSETALAEENNQLYTTSFYGCSNLQTVHMNREVSLARGDNDNNHVYRISPFSDLTSIETIYIGEYVTSISYNMFDCNNTSSCKLSTVYCYATNVPTLAYQAFGAHTDLTLYVYDEVVETFKDDTQTYSWPSFFSTIEGMGSKPLDEGTYKDVTTSLYFELNEDSTASIYYDEIGTYTNDNLVPHATIANAYTLPETVSADGETYYDVTRVEVSAFQSSNIEGHLVIPANIVAIGPAAFENCEGLNEVTLEYAEDALLDENTSEETSSFRYCSNLKTVNMYRNVTTSGSQTGFFCYHTSITTVNIGPRVTEMPDYFFYGIARKSTINCYALTPPSFTENPFNELGGAGIYVPFGLIETYEDQWGGIYPVEEMTDAFAITTHDNNDGTAYATFYNSASDVELFNPDGDTELTAYVAYQLDTEDDGELCIDIMSIGNTVPATTGVIVETVTAGTYLAIATGEKTTFSGNNNLYGYDEEHITEAPDWSDYYYYLLSSYNGNVGFYWGAGDGGEFECQAHRAYLVLPQSAVYGSLGISIRKGNGDGDTTGISSVESAAEGATVKGIYTIQGVRVSNMNQPGLYIVDGKKVLVK